MKNKNMPTPEEYNANHINNLVMPNNKSTNIRCPLCGNEMTYGDDVLISINPPKRYVYCLPCDYSDTIFC